jgi:hypothetical protein
MPDGAILYLVATGGTPAASMLGEDNPAIALLTVLGGNPPAHVAVSSCPRITSSSCSMPTRPLAQLVVALRNAGRSHKPKRA